MYAAVQVFVTCWCIDKLLSSVTPRFLSRSEKSTSVSPIRIDWGISPEVDVLLDITSIASVFPSFSCNLFKVIQDLTSEKQSCIAEMVVSIWSRELEFCIWVSSANEWWQSEWRSKMSSRGFVYNTNRMSPRTEPWGAPYRRRNGSDFKPFITTFWAQSDRYDRIHDKAVPVMPNACCSQGSRMLWSIVSNAAERSGNVDDFD